MFLNHLLIFAEIDQFFIFHFEKVYFTSDFVQFNNLWDLNSLQFKFSFNTKVSTLSDEFYLSFINQTEDLQHFKNTENITSIYHYSIPNTKLFYPEPFIAAPSFMHSDLWFVHILVYQYWLWFVFIFIIVFFIITFLCIVRWCNMRVRPRRETRGVSRSKCGDLITAIVPVSWAASIIISESTDAIDYFDGFGTTEMVVGIRAYQWGWEYYYPKDIDLNYNVKRNNSAFFGNSLKYSKTSAINSHANSVWKFYQNKPYDFVVTPAHLLLLPIDNYKILNYLNFSDVGTNAFHESSIFKHTRMLSKLFPFNLVAANDDFLNKYNKLSPLFISDYDVFDSYLYGLKRQHTLLNLKNVNNGFTTLFNLKNANKLLSYNYKFDNSLATFKGKFLINFYKPFQFQIKSDIWLKNNVASLFYQTSSLLKFNKFLTYASIFEKINDNSDKKKIKNSVLKILSLNPKKTILQDRKFFSNSVLTNNNLISAALKFNDTFQNSRLTKKIFVSSSSNQFVVKNNQTVKGLANISVKKGHFNMTSNTNSSTFFLNQVNKNINFTLPSLLASKNFRWTDLFITNKLLGTKIYFDAPTPVFLSNNPMISLHNYDDYENSPVEDTFSGYQLREELASDIMYRAYWNMYLGNTDVFWRLNNSRNFHNVNNSFYFPFFTFGYDYDFRNWQGLSLLEDSYWESINSIYLADEYAVMNDEYDDYTYFSKHERKFMRKDKMVKIPDNVISEPFLDDIWAPQSAYSGSLFSEDSIPSSSLLPTWEFNIFPVINNSLLMDESFDFFKSLNYVYFYNSKNLLNYLTNYFSYSNHFFVVDLLRSDAEDFSWFYDEKNLTKDFTFFSNDLTLSINFLLKYWNVNFFKMLFYTIWLKDINTSVSYKPFFFDLVDSADDNSQDFNFYKSLRFSNYFQLRATSKNAIGNYNAYQKVYKPRFDENRSHAKATDFANIFSKQPNLSVQKIRFDRLLGKSKQNFFQVSTYKNENLSNFNVLYDALNALNYYFFDFPFLLSLKSDASRYFWIDWFSRWGMFEVQPSSSSKYAITGVPYFNKNFDFNGSINGELVDTESYFLRISRARKNYLPAWIHTPYFYAKNVSFYKNNLFFEVLSFRTRTLIKTQQLLDLSDWILDDIVYPSSSKHLFFASNTNINSFGRSFWNFSSPISAYYFRVSTIVDILTKREYLYREFLFSRKKIINMASFMTASPKNSLLSDLKSAFLLNDPTTFNIEYSRDIYYSSLQYYHSKIMTPNIINSLVVLGLPLDLITLFVDKISVNSKPTQTFQTELLKSQYRPMRKGITNMVRLHGTGAVAMPIEIRLQILASSKDVIHSWAIPSAGVKIDCVPGYSSHRVLIFLVSGIFWGQCMEVCGRYHHWMPVIVYFMKRDLFFLWCTHFVFLSGANNMWVINDRQYTNYARTVSFDRSTWINETK